MRGHEVIAEAAAAGFSRVGGVFRRGHGADALQLYVAASVDPRQNEGYPGWDVVDPDGALDRHAWVELSCRSRVLTSNFLLRDRASWLAWGSGLASRVGDRKFARRFHLHGPPTVETLAPFTANVRRALLGVPRCGGFQVFASRLDEWDHASFGANWPLRKAPGGLVSTVAEALEMIGNAGRAVPYRA